METITTTANGLPSLLDGLAKEAQYYSTTAVSSMLQLGRVLCEAKQLVKRGEWQTWISENAGCSERTAQQFMQAYGRFGSNAKAAQIGERSKLFRMLSLPEGTEDEFMESHDIASMTSREVEEAVRQVRAEMEERVQAAEKKAREMSARADEVPQHIMAELTDKERVIREQQQEIERAANDGRDAIQEANRLRTENANLQRDVRERDEMLEEAQENYNRIQADLLSLQSMAAKGDAERVPADELTIDVFASAVRQFVGTCARMPHMAHTFSAMRSDEWHSYDELLRTIEGWAKDARKAIDTFNAEEVRIHG